MSSTKRSSFLILKVFLFLFSFWAVQRFCHKQTEGFELYKIRSEQEIESPALSPSLSDEDRAALQTIFSQPFYFLASGGQSYAFISQDQKTILKFFKNHHIRFWQWLNRLPLPTSLESYRQKMLRKKQHQSPAFFESCKISYLEFRERTGLIYLHLHKAPCFNRQLTLIDKLGIAHSIDLDSTPFALQKTAEFTKPKLKKLIVENDITAAKQCLESLLGLMVERCQKGIRDRDPNFRRNVGFIGNQAIEIDIGSYSKDESLKTPEKFKEEVLDKTQKLKRWLQRKSPELHLYLCQRIENLLTNTLLEE
jgi:hypothetical protein